MFSKEQIASAQYTIVPPATSNDGILVTDTNGRNYSIPLTTENADYVTVMDWVADGNTIQDAD
jgi:hypothetical protein